MKEPDHLSPADADAMAAVHGESFPRPWTAKDLGDLLQSPGGFGIGLKEGGILQGFVLMRVVADEAEVLTLAVRPQERRRGLASRLLEHALVQVAGLGAARVFLEVAADNAPARMLYEGLGFGEVARRQAYYERDDGAFEDACVLSLSLKQAGESKGCDA